MEMNTIGSEN